MPSAKESLTIYNTFSRSKEVLQPRDPNHVTFYVCGPTVYDRAHIGNARPVVVFDVLFRLLQHHYPSVTYVRNITDVDDKIIKAARDKNESIDALTQRMTAYYHQDMEALNTLSPTLEPRATDYISEMHDVIHSLLAKGHAYEANNHVLFDVRSDPAYGCLSHVSHDERLAGARVDVAPYKKNPEDFVLWKPSDVDNVGWESPWGRGRPGWHIECSAMSRATLGIQFDIHGGGIDLVFPHHENEIAQSTCAHGVLPARYWMHNGHLQVNGDKMSKSLGNFFTVDDLLHRYPGEVIRLVLLGAHYRQPLDWTEVGAQQARNILDRWYRALQECDELVNLENVPISLIEALNDDLNTSQAFLVMHDLAAAIQKTNNLDERLNFQRQLKAAGHMLGLLSHTAQQWFQGAPVGLQAHEIDTLIQERNEARSQKDFKRADSIREKLDQYHVILEDTDKGTTWRCLLPNDRKKDCERD